MSDKRIRSKNAKLQGEHGKTAPIKSNPRLLSSIGKKLGTNGGRKGPYGSRIIKKELISQFTAGEGLRKERKI